MSAQTMAEARGGSLRALDPDLSLVAARAAMQLDAVLIATKNGAAGNLRTDAIAQLSKLMESFTQGGEAAGDVKALRDPLTASILSRAYSDANKSKPLSSWKDVIAAAEKLSESFQKAQDSKGAADALKLLRDFCVKLSEHAAAKRKLAYGERPVPHYWRLV